MTDFSFQCRTKTGFGKKAVDHLPFDLSAMGASKAMVIQDDPADRGRLGQKMAKAFGDSGMAVGITPPLPGIQGDGAAGFIKSAFEAYREKGYDSIIALGGEAAADTAKALNIAVTLGPEALNTCNITSPLTPMVYLPTGVATGTASAGLCSFNNQKYESGFLAPNQVLMDPSFFIADQREDLLDEALACLAVACEAFALSHNPPARAYSTTVIRLVMPVLNGLTESGLAPEDNLPRRKKQEKKWQQSLVQASVLTGYLMTGQQTDKGADDPGIRPMGMAMADKSRLTPGLAMALILPRRLESAPPRQTADLLLHLTGPKDFSAAPAPQRAAAAVHTVRNLINQLHLISRGQMPRTAEEAGWSKAALESLEHEIKERS